MTCIHPKYCDETHYEVITKRNFSFLSFAQNDPFFMAPCRETRESILKIIRVSHSSNFYDIPWTAPADDGGSPITGYRMILQKGENEIKKDNITDPGTTTYSLRGLERNTNYTVKLFSRNFVFEGDPNVRTIRTKFEGEESQVISLLSTID